MINSAFFNRKIYFIVEYNIGDFMKCNRCNNKNRFLFRKLYCPNCSTCYYCLKCAHISIFKVCEDVCNDFEYLFKQVDYKLNYNLTINQYNLSKSVVENIESTNIFINATCGAGKTEIVFEVIKRFINARKKVCFATPRIEVTTELYYRFNKAFNETFAIITGELKINKGAMIFLTCNQLINFKDYFDLVIVDEVDAFPLANDPVLKAGIKRACNDNGKLIFMSATPLKIDKTFKEYLLNERYHKKPIPIPEYISLNSSIDNLTSSGKWIVFFPTIKCLNEVLSQSSNKRIVICHSKVCSKLNQLDSLNDNFVIYSTAILERGITIANVNVIVYDATHKNFSKSTLIQICGRVGRVLPYYSGMIYYMCDHKSLATKSSIKYLESLND